VGLTVNQEKTKVMELLGNDKEIFAMDGLVFEKVNQLKDLGATIKSNND